MNALLLITFAIVFVVARRYFLFVRKSLPEAHMFAFIYQVRINSTREANVRTASVFLSDRQILVHEDFLATLNTREFIAVLHHERCHMTLRTSCEMLCDDWSARKGYAKELVDVLQRCGETSRVVRLKRLYF